MTDTELRALVRDAVARHLGRGNPPEALALSGIEGMPILTEPMPAPAQARHASHAQYFTLINIGDDCVIEPSVKCNHCGYCKSHGH
jgi:hypothetical protein